MSESAAAAAMPLPESPAALVPPTDHVFRSHLRTPPTNPLVANLRTWLKGGSGGSGAYSADAATLFAIACGWSYGDGQTLADVLHRCGFAGTCRRVSVTSGALFVDTDAYVLSCDAFTAIVFRGTEIGDSKIIDGLSDFYSQPAPFYGDDKAGNVHEGFQLAYLPIHDRLVDVLAAEDSSTPLFITGHSLGGALAVLAAATLERTNPEILDRLHSIYTFGQPMVGDHRFTQHCAQVFGNQTYRHVYQHDLVPQLPPRWTTDVFGHFGTEYRGRKGHGWTLHKKPIRQVWTALVPLAIAAGVFVAKQVKGLKTVADWLPYSLDDHRPQAYIACSKDASRPTTGSFVFP